MGRIHNTECAQNQRRFQKVSWFFSTKKLPGPGSVQTHTIFCAWLVPIDATKLRISAHIENPEKIIDILVLEVVNSSFWLL